MITLSASIRVIPEYVYPNVEFLGRRVGPPESAAAFFAPAADKSGSRRARDQALSTLA
jgi:hypothetical protein